MKTRNKILASILALVFGIASMAWAGTISQQPYGISTPYWYGYSSGAPASYYLAAPTLSANDTAVSLAATQTLTNKTLTSPTITGATFTGLDRTDLGDVTTNLYVPMLRDVVQAAAAKDALPDSPNGTTLGLADAAGSPILATTDNGVSISETGMLNIALPDNYTAGQLVTVIIRAKITVLPTVESSNTVDVVAKEYADGALGSDICATAAQVTTAAYANYSFTITPTALIAGDILNLVITAAANDTGGTTNGIHSISKISILYNGV